MRRVLRDGGGYCVGTPNRLRVLGYLGSKRATLREKVTWNLADWGARLRGRFRNHHGAHAGFSPAELRDLLAHAFSRVEEVSAQYYREVYPHLAPWITLLHASGMDRAVFPSVYFMGTK
jgi:hypothetical protein